MTVLRDQYIARRSHGASTGRRSVLHQGRQRRAIRRDSTKRRLFGPFGLFALVAVLAVALILVVPRLEARSSALVPEGHDQASAASLLAFWGWDEEMPAADDQRTTIASPVDFVTTDDVEYVVEEGETLSEIALAHDVDYDLLAALNGIPDPNTISAGARIIIPGTLSRGRGLTREILSDLYPSTIR